jgi:hypothetical protein
MHETIFGVKVSLRCVCVAHLMHEERVRASVPALHLRGVFVGENCEAFLRHGHSGENEKGGGSWSSRCCEAKCSCALQLEGCLHPL